MYQHNWPSCGVLFVFVLFVCLLSSAALVVSIVAAARKNVVNTSPSPNPSPPPSGPTPLPTLLPDIFSINTECNPLAFPDAEGQLVATFFVLSDGQGASGVPYISINFDPDDFVTLNTALTPTFTDENGVLRVFVDTTQQTGPVSFTTEFAIQGELPILCTFTVETA